MSDAELPESIPKPEEEHYRIEPGTPFNVPGLMYAFYCFCIAIAFYVIGQKGEAYYHWAPVICSIPALLFLSESIFLLFLEPTVIVSEESVRYHYRRPSIWKRSSRLFRWPGERKEEEHSIDAFDAIVLDYTRVPFPLPIFPFSRGFFSITRWVLALRREDGEYLLLEIGPSPDSLRDMARKASDYTGLPLRKPGQQLDSEEAANWELDVFDRDVDPWDYLDEGFRASELSYQKQGEEQFAVRCGQSKSILKRGGMLVISLLVLLCGIWIVLMGLQLQPSPTGIAKAILMMLSGTTMGIVGFFMMASAIQQASCTVAFAYGTIEIHAPLHRSANIPLEEILLINGIYTRSRCSDSFGLGKETPVIEIYGKENWISLPVQRQEEMEAFQRFFRVLYQRQEEDVDRLETSFHHRGTERQK